MACASLVANSNPRALFNSSDARKTEKSRTRLRAHKEGDGWHESSAGGTSSDEGATETVIYLERKGEGWGEQILPSVSVQKRRMTSFDRYKVLPGSNEEILCQYGLDESSALEIVKLASSWRKTHRGRPLVDRKKRRDVRINIPMVIDLLKEEGCPPDGVKDVLWRFPHILLLRPPLNKFFQGLIRYILTVKMEFIEPTPSVRQELFSWTSELRRSKHYGYLTVGKEMWLDSISFEWGPIDETWEYMFDMLLDFSLDTGHVNPEEGSQLAEWLQRQQELYRLGYLPEFGKQRLESLGVEFTELPKEFLDNFFKLRRFLQQWGHCCPPPGHELESFVEEQRRRYWELALPLKAEVLLERINFSFTPQSNGWLRRVEQLKAYVDVHGTARVDSRHDAALANWLKAQRRARNQGKLDKTSIGILNNLGFVWDPVSYDWETRFNELKEFLEQNGHLNVSPSLPLNRWMNTQRELRRRGKLSAARRERLDAIGFPWDREESQWHGRLAQLAEFARSHGHLEVPHNEKTGLGRWVARQRSCFWRNDLSAKQVEQLEAIGFDFGQGIAERSGGEDGSDNVQPFPGLTA